MGGSGWIPFSGHVTESARYSGKSSCCITVSAATPPELLRLEMVVSGGVPRASWCVRVATA